MISPRYLTAVCVLVAIALVPALVHTYMDPGEHDSRPTVVLPPVAAGVPSVPSDRNAGWGKRRFDTNDWLERRYAVGRDDVVLTVVRSYDLKSLYHHPELAVAYRTPFGPERTSRFRSRPEIPVHVLPGEGDSAAVGLYVLVYDGRFIEEPIWFQLRTAGEQLFTPRKPMTLYFARDTNRDQRDAERLASVPLLFAAIDAATSSGPGR